MRDISIIFENQNILMKRLNKKVYEKYMDMFRERYGDIIDEYLVQLANSDAPEQSAETIAKTVVDQIFDKFSKRGKLKKTVMMEKELFMIYYLFPAILLTDDVNAKLLCDKIRDGWNARFNKNIDYTTYDVIYSGFVTKIFGVTINE